MHEPASDSDEGASDYDDDDEEADDFSEESSSDDTDSIEEDGEESMPLWNSEMSLEDLMKVREKVGVKAFNNKIFNKKNELESRSSQDGVRVKFKRETRNRPQEVSSKTRVPFLRQVIDVHKPKVQFRDPRFDDLCGSQFNEEIFNKSYAFLDDIRDREGERLRKMIRKARSDEHKGDLQYLLRRMKEQKKAKEQRTKKREMERAWKKEEKLKVEKGIKKPYFLTKKEKKKLFFQKKSEELKKLGKLEKAAAKQEKKRRAKEIKLMPDRRRTNERF